MKVSIVQLNSRDNKKDNITKALNFIEDAANKGADLVVLPEYVDFMGADEEKVNHGETIPGPTSEAFARKAKECGVFLNCGSILEVADENHVYNTSLLIDRDGKIIATYRKIHLYDADFEKRYTEKESDTIKPGNKIVTADTPFGKVGLTICYDLRFPELFRSLAVQGAKVIFVPAAFPLYTGAHHWEILLRARAIENQCYIVAAGQIGTSPPNRVTFGNSMIIDPWGTILAKPQEGEGIAVQDIDLEYVDQLRKSAPNFLHRKPEIYQVH